MTSVVVDRLCR